MASNQRKHMISYLNSDGKSDNTFSKIPTSAFCGKKYDDIISFGNWIFKIFVFQKGLTQPNDTKINMKGNNGFMLSKWPDEDNEKWSFCNVSDTFSWIPPILITSKVRASQLK